MIRRLSAVVAVLFLLIVPGCRQNAAFPEVRDLNSVRISLRRTICSGTCPSYSVEILGNGQVNYEGRDYVAVPGYQHARIPQQKVKDLLERFRKANFYSLSEEYKGKQADQAYYTVTLSIDGEEKKVVDYVGKEAGMPAVVTELEEAIDLAANTSHWVGER